ncbi:MAG: tetratricopeptide repeat protein [Phycisphaerae bacterium]|nr:tetratricopeptide repeat protein [Phycisphaerae bacterium]
MSTRFPRTPLARVPLGAVMAAVFALLVSCDRKDEEHPPKPASSQPKPKAVSARPSDRPAATQAFHIPEIELVGVPGAIVNEAAAAVAAARESPDDPQKTGELGMMYFVGDSSVAAAACFARAAQLDPESFRWWYYLALARERMYDLQGAIAAYEKALALDGSYVPVLIRLADLLIESSGGRAAALYRRALELDPNEARAYFGLGRRATIAGDSEEAYRFYRKAIEIAPGFTAAHNALAAMMSDAGYAAQAEAYLKTYEDSRAGEDPLPAINDPHFDALASKARGVFQPVLEAERMAEAGLLDEAAALLQKELDADASNAAARNSLGIVLSRQGKLDEATEQFRLVLAADPGSIRAKSNLGSALADAGKYEEAEVIFQQLLGDHPSDNAVRRSYASLLVVTGRSQEAMPLLVKLAEENPDAIVDHLNLAIASVCLKQFDEAIERYREAHDLLPDGQAFAPAFVIELVKVMVAQKRAALPEGTAHAVLEPQHMVLLADRFLAAGMKEESEAVRNYVHILAAQAMVLTRQGRFDQAIKFLEDAMGADVGGVLRASLGAVHAVRGQPEEAVKQFRLALQDNPGLHTVKSSLGHALAQLGKADEAERLFREVLDRLPDDAITLQRLGVLLASRDRKEEALSVLRRAVRVQPDNPANHYHLGELLARLGNNAEAVGSLREAVRLSPNNAVARYQLGLVLSRSGDTVAAKEEWQEVIKTAPAFADAYLALVGDALERKDHASALRLLRKGLEHAPDSALLANGLAWVLATCPDEGRRDGAEAVQWAEKACEMTRRGDPEFLDTLAAAYAEAGRFEEAIKTERNAIELATQKGQTSALEAYQRRLALFEAGKPYHEEG